MKNLFLSLSFAFISTSCSGLNEQECKALKSQYISEIKYEKALLPAPTKVTATTKKISGGKVTSSDGKVMPFAFIEKGQFKAEDKRPLFICMHGGGQNTKAKSAHGWDVNSREFQTQVYFAMKRYPSSGLYFVPRMADDRLGRWKHGHNIEIFERVIRPERVSWIAQETFGRYRPRFYWIGLPQKPANEKTAWIIDAKCDKASNTVNIKFASKGFKNKKEEIAAPAITGQKLQLFLDDQLVDLDKTVTVILNGKQVFKGRIERKAETLKQTLEQNGDPAYAFPCLLEFTL